MLGKLVNCMCRCFVGDSQSYGNRLLPEGISLDHPLISTGYTLLVYGLSLSALHSTQISDAFYTVRILKVSCGRQHILILTDNNKVLSAGSNEYGQCGRNSPDIEILDLQPVTIEDCTPIDIAAGAYHSLVLVESKHRLSVFAFGHEVVFELKEHKTIPTVLTFPPEYNDLKISAVVAAYMRSAVIFENSTVLVWGEWDFRSRKHSHLPLAIDPHDSIAKMAIGQEHCLILTTKGLVYVFGDNTYGELGLGFSVKNSKKPTILELPSEVPAVDIAAGTRHSLVLDKTGVLFAFGDNSEGQSLLSLKRAYCPTQTSFRSRKVVQIWAGETHSALLTSEGESYVWGDNTNKRLGVDCRHNVFEALPVDELFGKSVCGVGLGGTFSLFI